MNRPIIAVPMGDPAGIGPEIIIKALGEEINKIARVAVVGDKRVLKNAMTFFNMPRLKINVIEDTKNGIYQDGIINVVDLKNISLSEFEIGKVNASCGVASFEYIKKATELVLSKKADAIATAPINKESLNCGKVPFIGHTEIFASLTNTQNPLTIFSLNDTLVFFLSRHKSLINACKDIKKDELIDCVKKSFIAMKNLGIKDPDMAVAGLNPHCGEHGLFGDEEVKEITPAVLELQEMGYNVAGPIGADSVFFQAFSGKYKSVLSLYHDQGHIATKSVDFYKTISITAGMPLLRTSVDHGTAFDIAGRGTATDISMKEAIKVAVKYSTYKNLYTQN